MKKLNDLTGHKLKGVRDLSSKMLNSERIVTSKLREVDSAYKVNEILGYKALRIVRVNYSNDYVITVSEV